MSAYAATLEAESERRGVALGSPRRDDDGWEAKLALAVAERVPVVSFTFGCPAREVFEQLHAAGAETWVTVTTPAEARVARDAGADALVVQGVEAGGHRGSFDDDAGSDLGLLAALQLIGAAVELPLVATGGLSSGRSVAAVLAAGAAAAQLGTAFMRTPEAGTSPAHRAALAASDPTALTRAFTGPLRARGGQPLHARALARRPRGLSGDPSPHRAAARRRPRARATPAASTCGRARPTRWPRSCRRASWCAASPPTPLRRSTRLRARLDP